MNVISHNCVDCHAWFTGLPAFIGWCVLLKWGSFWSCSGSSGGYNWEWCEWSVLTMGSLSLWKLWQTLWDILSPFKQLSYSSICFSFLHGDMVILWYCDMPVWVTAMALRVQVRSSLLSSPSKWESNQEVYEHYRVIIGWRSASLSRKTLKYGWL